MMKIFFGEYTASQTRFMAYKIYYTSSNKQIGHVN